MGETATRRWNFGLARLMATVACVACLLGGLAWVEREIGITVLYQSFQLAAYCLPRLFARAAVAGLVISLIAAICDRRVWRLRALWLLLPVAIPIAILVFGDVFRADRGTPRLLADSRGEIVEWSPWLHVPVGIILLGCFRSISNWIIIVGISVATMWFSYGAAIYSWMCVTNIWM
jgi:hypothetical protein